MALATRVFTAFRHGVTQDRIFTTDLGHDVQQAPAGGDHLALGEALSEASLARDFGAHGWGGGHGDRRGQVHGIGALYQSAASAVRMTIHGPGRSGFFDLKDVGVRAKRIRL
jgi:hypothetical protein